VAEQDDTVRELSRLLVAALACDEPAGARAADRIATRLGIGEDDDAGATEAVLRRALGMPPGPGDAR
jgi:hypothetical protein